jgi:hypothetical protein
LVVGVGGTVSYSLGKHARVARHKRSVVGVRSWAIYLHAERVRRDVLVRSDDVDRLRRGDACEVGVRAGSELEQPRKVGR